MLNLHISVLSSEQIDKNIEEIARLRINIFKEYPYLYDGDFEYETRYLKKFTQTPDSMMVVVKDNERVVGAMTGLPLQYEENSIQEPWIVHNKDNKNVYYFSEFLICPEYRGKGLGKKIFELAETTITQLKKYDLFSLATVIRPENHPALPGNYKKLDAFWQQNGYMKKSNLICHIPWKEIGEHEESSKPLIFWLKKVPAAVAV